MSTMNVTKKTADSIGGKPIISVEGDGYYVIEPMNEITLSARDVVCVAHMTLYDSPDGVYARLDGGSAVVTFGAHDVKSLKQMIARHYIGVYKPDRIVIMDGDDDVSGLVVYVLKEEK